MDTPIRVFVGCAANNEDIESFAVLEYTLRKYASEPVEIEWMRQSPDPDDFWAGWNTSGWVTPFSGFRYGIPARCGFEGRAIYMDSDMILLDDIAKLWNTPLLPNAAIVAKGAAKRLCVMLMDCEKLARYTAPIEQIRSQAGYYRTQRDKWLGTLGLVQPFRAHENWNCLDGEGYKDLSHPDIKCIHYTAIDTQPQLKHALPRLQKAGQRHWFGGRAREHGRKDLIRLFDTLLDEARAAGYPPEKYMVEAQAIYAAGSSDGGGWKNPGARQELARVGKI